MPVPDPVIAQRIAVVIEDGRRDHNYRWGQHVATGLLDNYPEPILIRIDPT